MNFKKLSQGALALALSLSVGVPAWGSYVSVKDGTITTAKLAAAAVTQAKRAALGQQVSSACTSYTLTGSRADVTNLSVTITTTGRPVYVGIIPDGNTFSSSSGDVSQIIISVNSSFVCLNFDRSGTNLGDHLFAGNQNDAHALSGFHMIDVPASGTYTYKLRGYNCLAGGAILYHVKLIAFEL